METIRKSPGGHKLSQEALEAIVILAGDVLLPHDEEKLGAEILLNAEDYVWKQNQHHASEIRLEVCNLLHRLASECAFPESALSTLEDLANLTAIRPMDRKKLQ